MLKRLIPLMICALYAVTTYALDCNDEGVYSVSTVEDLRAAVNCGNSDGIDTQISLATSTYDLSGGQIEIYERVSIIGVTAETTILDAMSIDGVKDNRHFYVYGAEANLTLENLTLQNGYADKGGAIYISSSATVALNKSTLSENTASSQGGAIALYSSTISINNGLLSGNTAKSGGGAMYVRSSTANLDETILSGNTTSASGGALYIAYSTVNLDHNIISGNGAYDYGGAMAISFSTVSLDNSTVSGNRAYDYSGGAMQIESYATVRLNNSTLSGNAAQYGGAMVINNYVTLSLDNSTLSGNTAYYAGDAIYSSSAYPNSLIGLRNSIFDNTAQNCDTSGNPVTSYGYNLATDDSCNLTAEGDQQNTDPMLDVLADNGGPTMTHALLEGSPAIDEGNCTDSEGYTVETDQRGYARPAGVTCDSGSYEYGASAEETLTATLKKKCYIQDDGSYSTGCDGTRTEKGKVTYTLLWDGFADSTVDIWVDGSIYLSATANDEAEFITLTQDYIASTFKVCEVGTSVCSNEVQELMTTTGMQTGTTDGQDGQRRYR